jgi:hypothetical protein
MIQEITFFRTTMDFRYDLADESHKCCWTTASCQEAETLDVLVFGQVRGEYGSEGLGNHLVEGNEPSLQ